MASKAKPKLERIPAASDEMLKLGHDELLMLPDKRAAADELYRRAFNKFVKKQQQA